MNFYKNTLLFIGGGIGTLARYGLSMLALPISKDFPINTMIINITGSFIIGLFGTLTLASGKFPVPEDIRLFVMVGLCGGFTTFSSFSLQTLDLIRNGLIIRALVNIGLSVILCLCSVTIGHVTANYLNGRVI
ncbi:fluoride efflux transporter CrcB [Liberibacter crescens]|uniref:fluoride efflux transporter CrcB n=1 Tax=Liberibacter crescens TaxID=1273132 RepID=UPI0005A22E7E|nr:fluoride efflux transporter CrcB [Liberibacter crescens]AMC13170.1 camphor resistance protein CrcB [Liberibacter crescens]